MHRHYSRLELGLPINDNQPNKMLHLLLWTEEDHQNDNTHFHLYALYAVHLWATPIGHPSDSTAEAKYWHLQYQTHSLQSRDRNLHRPKQYQK